MLLRDYEEALKNFEDKNLQKCKWLRLNPFYTNL